MSLKKVFCLYKTIYQPQSREILANLGLQLFKKELIWLVTDVMCKYTQGIFQETSEIKIDMQYYEN